MQQGGDGRGGDHRAAKPALEGKLRGFGEGRETEEGEGQHGRRGVHDHGLGEHGLNGQSADGLLHEQHGADKGDAAHHVHPQGAGGVALGFAGPVVADEEEGAQGSDFPEEEDPRQAVAEHEAVHGSQEKEQQKEEARLTRFDEAQVILMLLHVAECEKAHHAAHEGNHEDHDEGQRIGEECGGLMALKHEEIQIEHTRELAEGQPDAQPVPDAHRYVQDVREQGEIEHCHEGLERAVRGHGQREAAVEGQTERGQCGDPGTGVHNTAAQGSFFVQGYSDSRDERENDAAEEEQLQHGRLT